MSSTPVTEHSASVRTALAPPKLTQLLSTETVAHEHTATMVWSAER